MTLAASGDQPCVQPLGKGTVEVLPAWAASTAHEYTFDAVLGQDASQDEVFEGRLLSARCMCNLMVWGFLSVRHKNRIGTPMSLSVFILVEYIESAIGHVSTQRVGKRLHSSLPSLREMGSLLPKQELASLSDLPVR